MLDNAAYELAERLYEPVRHLRDRQLAEFVKSATGTAAGKGTLGAGFFHKSLADRHVDELRQRADSLLHILKQLAASSTVSADTVGLSRLSQFLEGHIRRDADALTSRLGELLQRFDGKATLYVAEMADEVPRVVDKLRAELELFARQQGAQRVQQRPALSDAPEVLPDPRRVFVVHGRDNQLVADMFAFLEAVGLQPIEWREAVRQTGKGAPYIGEILEMAFGTAQAVVVLLSPDDEVRLVPSLLRKDDEAIEREMRMQPRPNVLFEAGMAFGYRRDRTILVEVGSPKPFSDIAGRHTIRLSNNGGRREDFIERLKTAGCKVDISSGSWRGTGNFELSRGGAVVPMALPLTSAPKVKFVDMNYPHDSGLQSKFEAEGYRVRWCDETNLARRLDIDGWSLATMTDAEGSEVILKMKDRPEDQTLIKKKEAKL
jgi:predicted nucleotide-binding protein